MPWIITKDHLYEPGDDLPSRVGFTSRNFQDGTDTSTWHKFRMLDDDGEECYEGLSNAPDFHPLDELGTPDAGCTEIQYFLNGKWTTL